jgi:hypothetical protein
MRFILTAMLVVTSISVAGTFSTSATPISAAAINGAAASVDAVKHDQLERVQHWRWGSRHGHRRWGSRAGCRRCNRWRCWWVC